MKKSKILAKLANLAKNNPSQRKSLGNKLGPGVLTMLDRQMIDSDYGRRVLENTSRKTKKTNNPNRR